MREEVKYLPGCLDFCVPWLWNVLLTFQTRSSRAYRRMIVHKPPWIFAVPGNGIEAEKGTSVRNKPSVLRMATPQVLSVCTCLRTCLFRHFDLREVLCSQCPYRLGFKLVCQNQIHAHQQRMWLNLLLAFAGNIFGSPFAFIRSISVLFKTW